MWWQYAIVGALLGVAVYYLVRSMRRSLDPKAPACACGESCREGHREFGHGPQPVSDINPTACSTCSSQDRPQPSNRG